VYVLDVGVAFYVSC